MLRLEIEWLGDVCRAARGQADEAPDWPVQPDRIFSALVASWGALGEPEEGRAALEWLERTAIGRLLHVEGRARDGATRFVPPNDASDVTILPERRRRQARSFPATVLSRSNGSPHLALDWDAAPDAAVFAALQDLARGRRPTSAIRLRSCAAASSPSRRMRPISRQRSLTMRHTLDGSAS